MSRLLAAPLTLACLSLSLSAAAAAEKGVPATNLAAVNTEADEDNPAVTSDNRTFLYASNAGGDFDLLLSVRRSPLTPFPKGLPLNDLNTDVDDRSACLITSAGRYPHYLYFATKKDREINNYDLYVAVKQGPNAAFTAPTPINAVDTENDELHPWITATGRELYFSRQTKEGWRVFVSSRPATGAFGPPKLVDLPAGFHHPTLTPDGGMMYLQGPLEGGRWGLFRSLRAGGAWSKPEPLEGLNHPEGKTGDRSPCLSRDGRVLYFASDRPGGKGGLDLWEVRTLELKRAK